MSNNYLSTWYSLWTAEWLYVISIHRRLPDDVLQLCTKGFIKLQNHNWKSLISRFTCLYSYVNSYSHRTQLSYNVHKGRMYLVILQSVTCSLPHLNHEQGRSYLEHLQFSYKHQDEHRTFSYDSTVMIKEGIEAVTGFFWDSIFVLPEWLLWSLVFATISSVIQELTSIATAKCWAILHSPTASSLICHNTRSIDKKKS